MTPERRRELHLAIESVLADVERLFTDGARVTLIVRNPQVEGDASVLVSNDDDIEAAITEIRRRAGD